MNSHTLPRALFAVLVAGVTAAPPAAALPPLHAELVDELELSHVSGKYFGANMLVGLRIDLVSTLHTPGSGSASASGSLSIQRVGNGFEVKLDSRSGVTAGDGSGGAASGAVTATGADGLQVSGIGQVSQIAGDGNRLANVTTIRFLPSGASLGDTTGFNGQASSHASDGTMTAQITFTDGALRMGVSGPGASLAQQFRSQGVGGVMQVGQIAGDGIIGSNQLQLQLLGNPMTLREQHQLGIQQALAGLSGLGH